MLRDELGHDGVIVTDDFSMGAIRKSKLGIGNAAVSALNAGVDLILVSYDPDQIYVVLDALLSAQAKGKLDAVKLSESNERLKLAAEEAFGPGRE
jgi:beta-N-acetylhexosaminidase